MSLFGSSGIRGRIGKEITADLALRIGQAVGSLHDRIIVGMDTRTSGDMMANALAAGAMSCGASVADAGNVSTPTLARAVRGHGCGLMVTASHNPPEYNGVKMWNPDGSAFDTPQMDEVEQLIESGSFRSPDWRGVGSRSTYPSAIREHMDAIEQALKGATSTLAVDCANGATTNISPLLLRELGCSVTSLNAQPDGFFPGRLPEPTEENLADLIRTVKEKKADIGLAHDGDGDRVVAVDERGRFVDGDRLLTLFAVRMKLKDVVAPVDASMVLDDLVEGKVFRTKVGDVFVAEEMKKRDVRFGGEPSGTYIFSDQTYCPDGVYAACLLAKLASEEKLGAMIDAIPKYPVARRSVSFKAEARTAVRKRLEEEMRAVDCERLVTVDGYRAEFKDGWFLVRISGTEPKLRITAEARAEEPLSMLTTLAEGVARRCVK